MIGQPYRAGRIDLCLAGHRNLEAGHKPVNQLHFEIARKPLISVRRSDAETHMFGRGVENIPATQGKTRETSVQLVLSIVGDQLPGLAVPLHAGLADPVSVATNRGVQERFLSKPALEISTPQEDLPLCPVLHRHPTRQPACAPIHQVQFQPVLGEVKHVQRFAIGCHYCLVHHPISL